MRKIIAILVIGVCAGSAWAGESVTSAPAAAAEPAAETAPAAAAAPAAETAVADPAASLRCFKRLERYVWDRESEFPAQVGQRFLADLRECNPVLAGNVTEAVRHQIQDNEAQKFVRQRGFVIAAYAIVWVVAVLFIVTIYASQRKLARALAEVESRLESQAGDRAA